MLFFESPDKKIGDKLNFIAYYIKRKWILIIFNIHYSYQLHQKEPLLFQFVEYFQQ